MSGDLVRRLRREVGPGDWIGDVRNDAADRIEALELQCEAYANISDRALMTKMKGYRDRIEQLEAALREIVSLDTPKSPTAQQVADVLENASDIARRALEGKHE